MPTNVLLSYLRLKDGNSTVAGKGGLEESCGDDEGVEVGDAGWK